MLHWDGVDIILAGGFGWGFVKLADQVRRSYYLGLKRLYLDI
jgi:hypothetical protein